MIKIPIEVQSVINAGYHINSFKGAVEELVYNALDADATSIAIRVDIHESLIQVIDNGSGIKGKDFNLLGKKYSTSKFVDIFGMKSMPRTYGYCGLSIATIIDICREIKIISRYQDSQETWIKVFFQRECKEISKTESRPSKGTTVEIKGFLYNLKIQRKAIETHNEMFAIKTLLEQLSLVHVNVSFSLRDDEKNDIVFQIHKNRDVCSTISNLFNILPIELQELQVEKKDYKVKALIGKRNIDFKKHQWIFLNRKFIFGSKIHKIMNKHLKKSLCIQQPKPTKMPYYHKDETYNQNLPFYFLFISCPNFDYDISFNVRKTIVEFKNWDHITSLLQKLVQCYCGEIKLKEITTKYINCDKGNQQLTKNNQINTREEVKKIIDKILINNPKKQKTLEMCNGIKGMNIKRRRKQKTVKSKHRHEINNKYNRAEIASSSLNKEHVSKLTISEAKKNTPKIFNVTRNNFKNQLLLEDKSNIIQNTEATLFSETLSPLTKGFSKSDINKNRPINFNYKKNNKLFKTNIQSEENDKYNKNDKVDDIKKNIVNDSILKKFLNPTESLKERCKLVEEASKKMLLNKINKKQPLKEKFNMNANKCSFKTRNNPNASEIVSYDIKQKKSNLSGKNTFNKNKINHYGVVSSYDLVHTILKSETDDMRQFDVQYKKTKIQPQSVIPESVHGSGYSNTISTKLTYESHKNYNLNKKIFKNKYIRKLHFTSRDPDDKFLLKKQLPFNLKPAVYKKKNCNKFNKTFLNTLKMDLQFNNKSNMQYDNLSQLYIDDNTTIDKTFIEEIKSRYDNTFNIENHISNFNKDLNKSINLKYDITYSIQLSKNIIYTPNENCDKNNDFIENSDVLDYNVIDDLNSNKQDHQTSDVKINEENIILYTENNDSTVNLDPLNICETVIDFTTKELEHKLNSIIANDSLFNPCENQQDDKKQETEITNVTSHHFNSLQTEEINEIFLDTFHLDDSKKQNHEMITENMKSILNLDNFTIQGRNTFMPKGMSPIIKNYNRKILNLCSNVEDEYYEDGIYKKFAEAVVETAQVFEPKIQNVNEITTNDINKVNNKIMKDNADLIFDAKSIKQAQVLGQVDCKFIATIMNGKVASSNTYSDFLVLFDQHAVHERIRLEKNLSDYFDGTTWNSVKIDGINFKLRKDDVIFLHNYKDKLGPFGLQWTISDDIITLYEIPQAIFGKIDRQVDAVLKATKSLLTELIDALKYLKGNIPLYPQTIMNIVFSEACRYAIMFGDKLSKYNCVVLLESLAQCKTPFQCAHGRPVMAVLMDIESYVPEYKINPEKVKIFNKDKKERRVDNLVDKQKTFKKL